MTEQLPDPLVPAEVDLRDFGFMPLDVQRLVTSETWIDAIDDPRIGHAAMSLWCEAWHQSPAGSLPDNDKVLYRLSMCPNLKEWQRVRDRVMSGWVKCSDGRLYHGTVAEKARDSWEKKLAQRARTAAATEARERKRREKEEAERALRDVERNVERNEQRDVERNDVRDVEREQPIHVDQGTVKGELRESKGIYIQPEVGDPPRRGQVAGWLTREGVKVSPAFLHGWVDELSATDAQLAEALARCRNEIRKPEQIAAKYFDTTLRRYLLEPAPDSSQVRVVPHGGRLVV